jgi:hypothetical protein
LEESVCRLEDLAYHLADLVYHSAEPVFLPEAAFHQLARKS